MSTLAECSTRIFLVVGNHPITVCHGDKVGWTVNSALSATRTLFPVDPKIEHVILDLLAQKVGALQPNFDYLLRFLA